MNGRQLPEQQRCAELGRLYRTSAAKLRKLRLEIEDAETKLAIMRKEERELNAVTVRYEGRLAEACEMVPR